MTGQLKLLTGNVGTANSTNIDAYMAGGGYEAMIDSLHKMTPTHVLNEVKNADLKGRGGAGFPAGLKWSFLPKGKDKQRYLICNADESEPGTFKDRLLIENDPHLILEGIIIAGWATQAAGCFFYIRGEMPKGAVIFRRAVKQAYKKGFLGKSILGSAFNFDVWIVRGAGAYICGEETALMNSLEGKRAEPRIKPPFPAGYGVYGKPSNINNVETFANVPMIVKKGADWYKSIGSKSLPGTKLYGVSGHVKKPGVYELPGGTNLKEIIYEHAGGILGDRPLKAVIPGGSSTPVLRADQIDVPADPEGLGSAGSMLGSGGIIVMNDTVCMVRALQNLMEFYADESCGQCTPCREGTTWLRRLVTRLEEGDGREGDCDLILDVADNVMGNTICPLGDAAAMPAISFVKQFREEFEAHITSGGCPMRAKEMTTRI